MDVLLDDVVAADPGEVVPVAHLVFHFSELAAVGLLEVRAFLEPGRIAVPVGTHGGDVADRAVMQALYGLDVALLVMALQAHADFQSFFLRDFRRGEDLAHARRIGRHGLLHEDVFALLDRLFKHHRAEPGRRGKDDDIGLCDRLLVRVESEEAVLLRDAPALIEFRLEILQRGVHAILVHVRRGDELDGSEIRGVQRLSARAGAASAAADDGELDLVAAARAERET